MSRISAEFFAWVQGAPFYVETHGAAVRLLPPGDGRTWLDVGCGPGLVTRLASQRGYDATGLDLDPEMIRAARRLARDEACRFNVGDVATARAAADVVSAASLLFVLPDARAGLLQLWSAVRPGGTLLLVETTTAMTPARAAQTMSSQKPGRHLALTLWAKARRGRAVDRRVFDAIRSRSRKRHLLLDGLVEAWTFDKAA